jgi:hypothetical protein
MLLIMNLDDSAGVNRFETKPFKGQSAAVRCKGAVDTATDAAVLHQDWGDFKTQESIQQQEAAGSVH